jgi:DNA repair protein RecN (Recombination protein N)
MLAEAEFQVIVQKDQLSATGIDTVDFSFRANQRLDFGPLSKVASGGELSRLMLALEVVLAQKSQQQTFIFDEVDTGVGGKTAIEIAKRLKKLSLVAQVVLVTHLPQIAAFADRNLVVEKAQTKDSVSTQVKAVSADAKVLEISRMLAGLEGSATALGHAEELIDMARSL